jgi:hypothetical protein
MSASNRQQDNNLWVLRQTQKAPVIDQRTDQQLEEPFSAIQSSKAVELSDLPNFHGETRNWEEVDDERLHHIQETQICVCQHVLTSLEVEKHARDSL